MIDGGIPNLPAGQEKGTQLNNSVVSSPLRAHRPMTHRNLANLHRSETPSPTIDLASRAGESRVIELSSLRELITSKPINGWGEDPKKVEAVIKDDPEALAILRVQG